MCGKMKLSSRETNFRENKQTNEKERNLELRIRENHLGVKPTNRLLLVELTITFSLGTEGELGET